MTASVSFDLSVLVSLRRAKALGVIIEPMAGDDGVTVEPPKGRHRAAAVRLIAGLSEANPDYRDAFIKAARASSDAAAQGGAA